jgi:N-methylhydantoinase A
LAGEGFSLRGLWVETALDMRYAGQSHELPLVVRSLAPERFVPAFHRAHNARFGHADDSRAVEVVNVRVKLLLPAPVGARQAAPVRVGARQRSAKAAERGDVWFEGRALSTPLYERGSLLSGMAVAGPAVVTQLDCTTVISPGWAGRVDGAGNLVLRRR